MSSLGPWWSSGTKSDIAAGAIGYATGFGVDVFFFPLGIPPGTTAGVFAVGAVGLKNAIQAALSGRQVKRKKNQRSPEESAVAFLEVVERAKKASTGAKSNAYADLERSVQADLALRKGDIWDDERLARALEEQIQKFRSIERIFAQPPLPPDGRLGRPRGEALPR